MISNQFNRDFSDSEEFETNEIFQSNESTNESNFVQNTDRAQIRMEDENPNKDLIVHSTSSAPASQVNIIENVESGSKWGFRNIPWKIVLLIICIAIHSLLKTNLHKSIMSIPSFKDECILTMGYNTINSINQQLELYHRERMIRAVRMDDIEMLKVLDISSFSRIGSTQKMFDEDVVDDEDFFFKKEKINLDSNVTKNIPGNSDLDNASSKSAASANDDESSNQNEMNSLQQNSVNSEISDKQNEKDFDSIKEPTENSPFNSNEHVENEHSSHVESNSDESKSKKNKISNNSQEKNYWKDVALVFIFRDEDYFSLKWMELLTNFQQILRIDDRQDNRFNTNRANSKQYFLHPNHIFAIEENAEHSKQLLKLLTPRTIPSIQLLIPSEGKKPKFIEFFQERDIHRLIKWLEINKVYLPEIKEEDYNKMDV